MVDRSRNLALSKRVDGIELNSEEYQHHNHPSDPFKSESKSHLSYVSESWLCQSRSVAEAQRRAIETMLSKQLEHSCEVGGCGDQKIWWVEEDSECNEVEMELKTSCKSVTFAVTDLQNTDLQRLERESEIVNNRDTSQDSKSALSSLNHGVDHEESNDN